MAEYVIKLADERGRIQEQVQVEAEPNTVSTNPDNNANAVVIKNC